MTVFDTSYSDRFSCVDVSPECVFDVVITLLSITLPAFHLDLDRFSTGIQNVDGGFLIAVF